MKLPKFTANDFPMFDDTRAQLAADQANLLLGIHARKEAEKRHEYLTMWRKKHPEKCREYNQRLKERRVYKNLTPEQVEQKKKYNRIWQEANKSKVQEYRAKYRKGGERYGYG